MEHLDSDQQVLRALGTANRALQDLESCVSALPEPHQGPIREFLAAQNVQSSADLVRLQEDDLVAAFQLWEDDILQLSEAAFHGNDEVVKRLCEVSPAYVTSEVARPGGGLPIHDAALAGHLSTVLLRNSMEICFCPKERKSNRWMLWTKLDQALRT